MKPQQKVIDALGWARYINIVTGNRAGKSFLERRIMHFWSSTLGNEDNCGILIGQDFKALNRNMVRPLHREWGNYIQNYDKNDHIITLVTGHLIYLISAENLKTIEGLSNAAYIIIDEASLIDEAVLDAADTRAIDLRAPLLTASTAVPGPGVAWLEEQFDKGLNPKYCGDDVDYYNRYASFSWTMFDNKTLDPNEIQNYMSRRSQKEIAVRVYGKFETIGDRVFDAALLKPEICGYYADEILGFDMEHYVFVDTASGQTENERGDRTAIIIVGIAPEYGIYVRECIADIMSVDEIQKTFISKCRQYRVHKAGIESIAAQINFLLSILRKAQRVEDSILIVPLRRIGGNNAKPARHGRLVPYIESGRLKLPIDEYGNFTHGCDVLIQEMKTTPYGRHDDCIDALSDVANPDMGIVEGIEMDSVPYQQRERPAYVPLMTRAQIEALDCDPDEEDILDFALN